MTDEDDLANAFKDAWRTDLPTEDQVKANHLRALEKSCIRALARLRTENLAEYYGLLERLAAAANNATVTRAKLDNLVKAEIAGQRRRRRTRRMTTTIR
jgi:hypothetical protein